MKRLFVIFLFVLTGVGAALTVAHLLLPALLRSEYHALLSNRTMLITLKKRGTSDLITFPVDYLREGDTVYVGCDSGWWKHLAGGADVRMLIKGTEFVGWAMPIVDDPDRIAAGFKKLRPWTYKRALWSGAVFVEVKIQSGSGTLPRVVILGDRGTLAPKKLLINSSETAFRGKHVLRQTQHERISFNISECLSVHPEPFTFAQDRRIAGRTEGFSTASKGRRAIL